MDSLNFIISAIAIVAGFVIGYFVRKYIAKREIEGAEAKAEHLINEAKNKQKEILLQARDKALKIIDDAKREEQQRRNELVHIQQ
ncbi:MAG: Rnase Y domain-containing protein, partial [Candidatus Parcubacteria bacterium]|nr:Rnase Y domain-containing protein [Candidatus Parcubacteria bacterium]